MSKLTLVSLYFIIVAMAGGTLMASNLKIAIADDEAMVCVVIQDAIRYDDIGLELTGIANDGLALLDIIDREKPDIVITDINMPGISGIDLIREVRQRNIKCRFIIVSGYSQFEYARNALKYQVDDYLLKPIDKDELNDALKKIRNSILDEREQINHNSMILEKQQQSNDTLRTLLFSHVFSGEPLPLMLDEINQKYGVSLQKGLFQAAAVKLDFIGESDDFELELASVHAKLVRIFIQLQEKYSYELLYHFEDTIIYLAVNYEEKHRQSTSKAFNDFFERARNVVNLFKELRITVGIGNAYPTFAEIKVSLEEAQHAVYYRIQTGFDMVIYFSKLPPQLVQLSDDERKNMLRLLQKDIESMNPESFSRTVSGFYSNFLVDPIELFLISFDIISLLCKVHNNLESEISDKRLHPDSLKRGLLNVTTRENLRSFTVDRVSQILVQLKENQKSLNAKPVRDVIRFIRMHYSEPLNLDRVSEEIFLNPVYISSIFKKETGENFTDYVNNYRIEVAKEKLRTTSESVSVISASVGIQDPKYFSKLFRKRVGLKPTEYRNIYGI